MQEGVVVMHVVAEEVHIVIALIDQPVVGVGEGAREAHVKEALRPGIPMRCYERQGQGGGADQGEGRGQETLREMEGPCKDLVSHITLYYIIFYL